MKRMFRGEKNWHRQWMDSTMGQSLPCVGITTTANWPKRWHAPGRRNSSSTWLWPAVTDRLAPTDWYCAPALHCWNRCWRRPTIRPLATPIRCSISTISNSTIWWLWSNSCTEAVWRSRTNLCPASSTLLKFLKYVVYLEVNWIGNKVH